MAKGSQRRVAAGNNGGRSAALAQLRALREHGGRRVDAFEVKLEDKIYDTVTEESYNDLVARRRTEARDFLIDDAGLGYADDGEEDDWENAHGREIASSDFDDDKGIEKLAKRMKKRKLVSEKKNKKKEALRPSKKAAELAAAAAMNGQQKVSSMFASASLLRKGIFGEKKGLGMNADSLVEQLIAEFAPDDSELEKRRRQRQAIKYGHMMNQRFQLSTSNVRSEKQMLQIDNIPEIAGIRDDSTAKIVNAQESYSNTEVEVPGESQGDISEEPKREQHDLKSDVPIPFCDEENIISEVKKTSNEEDIMPNSQMNQKLEKDGKRNFVLNAKVVETNVSAKAAGDWQAVWRSKFEDAEGNVDCLNIEDAGDLPLEEDKSMLFYLIDAYEEAFGANCGTVYLFGKVNYKGTYASCCVVVKNMHRCIFAIPKPCVFPDNVISEFEQGVKAGKVEEFTMRKKLQEMALSLKQELSGKLLELNVTSFIMVPVKRSYAFERSDVPTGRNYVVKLSYPFKDPPLPADLKGESFLTLFGTHTSALELFLIKRKIRGPTWLSISNAVCCHSSSRVSWCKFEASVSCAKYIKVASSPLEIPPVQVAAMNMKTVVNEKTNVNEVASLSVVYCRKTKIHCPMPKIEWNHAGMLGHFTVLRKPDGGVFPVGFTKEVSNRNSKAGSNILNCESSERAVLNLFFQKLHQLDPDVLVGHNISGFDLDVLMHRAQACKVPSGMWSKIGRLKRSLMPKLSRGSGSFGSGASLGLMSCIAGRLLCDTYLLSRELLKEVTYSLTNLARAQLGRDRKEIAPVDIPNMYQNSSSLLELVECGEMDAWLSLGLMFHLSALPLSRQLTNISGNLWSKTLLGSRAQRVEYLLLHEFHKKKYIVPDKISAREKDLAGSKRKLVAESKETIDEEAYIVDDGEQLNHGKSKKAPAYSGGLVLEPKNGLYDKYILLLDFNSLYPSIIQEYNICFTTVDRPSDGSIPVLPSSNTKGVLPELLKNLVGRRRQVKLWLKNTSDPLKYQQLDIQQQALKLTANSMYGCLGFANSRFYAKSLAELITSQGREILQSTVDLVQSNLNLEVIYGDTDSIMIHSGLDNVDEARLLAAKVIKKVNKKYKCLEIDLDGLYKRMLLLKKKKYAAVKMCFNSDGTRSEVIEQKGLDIVRRDWSLLSKDIGNFCLEQILSGGSCEDVVETIHAKLQKVVSTTHEAQEEMRNGQVELEKYVITKSLTKHPEEYPDSKNQPHVQVALRMKQKGHTIGVGEAIPYIICCQQGSEAGTTVIAERARHPEELKRDNDGWIIDINYYLSQQIHPVVTRLCAPIQGTSAGRLADCLGLDSSKFETKTSIDAVARDTADSFFSRLLDDEQRYQGCEPLIIKCPRCSAGLQCPSVLNMVSDLQKHVMDSGGNATAATPSRGSAKVTGVGPALCCLKCKEGGTLTEISAAMLENQVVTFAESILERYYRGFMVCDDEMCKHTTQEVNFRVVGDSERGAVCPNYPRCNGRLVSKYSEVDLYKQLTYLCRLFDLNNVVQKVDANSGSGRQRDILKRVRHLTEGAGRIARQIRNRCGYGWVQMNDLVIF